MQVIGMAEEEGSPMTPEEMNEEVLECARYGEHEDLLVLLEAGANVNHTGGYSRSFTTDYLVSFLPQMLLAIPRYTKATIISNSRSSLPSTAAANGQVECLKVLKSFNATPSPNSSGNFPIRESFSNSFVLL